MARTADRNRPAADPLSRARELLRHSPQGPLQRVISRSIAVGSGKGGVGKTITACNLAIFYARKDLRVGLVDLDPLSDVASLLDLYESEQALGPAPPARARGAPATAAAPRWKARSFPCSRAWTSCSRTRN